MVRLLQSTIFDPGGLVSDSFFLATVDLDMSFIDLNVTGERSSGRRPLRDFDKTLADSRISGRIRAIWLWLGLVQQDSIGRWLWNVRKSTESTNFAKVSDDIFLTIWRGYCDINFFAALDKCSGMIEQCRTERGFHTVARIELEKPSSVWLGLASGIIALDDWWRCLCRRRTCNRHGNAALQENGRGTDSEIVE